MKTFGTSEKQIILTLAKGRVTELWNTMCELQASNSETEKQYSAKVFSQLLGGTEHIDETNKRKFDEYLSSVCNAYGYREGSEKNSTIYLSCTNLRRIFESDPNYLAYEAAKLNHLGLKFSQPSQQQIFDFLDPVFNKISRQVTSAQFGQKGVSQTVKDFISQAFDEKSPVGRTL